MTRVRYTLVIHGIFDSMHFNGMTRVRFLMLILQRYFSFMSLEGMGGPFDMEGTHKIHMPRT